MANIVNAQAIAFTTGQIRPGAQAMLNMYKQAKAIVAAWNAMAISGVIPNTTDLIVDGQVMSPITGINATAIITQLQAFITTCEASSNAVLNDFVVVAVNP